MQLQIDAGRIKPALIAPFPVQQPGVLHEAGQARAQLHRPRKIHRGEPAAHAEDMFIRKTGETLESEFHRMSGGTAPAHGAAEHTRRQIQLAPVSQHRAAFHAEALAANHHDEVDPVRRVDQLGVDDGRIIEKPVDQRHRLLAGIALLEGAARPQIPVADGKHRLLVM